ncbi:hypothetical protein J6590_092386, partial [Homalodisca vitripennis]
MAFLKLCPRPSSNVLTLDKDLILQWVNALGPKKEDALGPKTGLWSVNGQCNAKGNLPLSPITLEIK